MRRRVLAALAAALFFYALSDVLLWQRIFETNDLYQYDALYQNGHEVTLVALIAVGVVLLWDLRLWALWWAAALYTLAFSGLEDVLYYWIGGHAVPAACPWLDKNPFVLFKPAGGDSLIASAAVWVALWLGILWVAPLVRSAASLRGRPEPPVMLNALLRVATRRLRV